LLGLAAFGALSSAHTVLTDILINDVHQGDGTCIRMPHDPSTASAPIASPFSNPDMACGRDGGKAVAFSCPATPGSKVTFEFRGWPDYAKPEVIDGSHKGPISIYAKAMSSFDDAAAGDGWFKIWEQGYDAASNTYATSKLIANKGLLSINLPDLPRGQYLIRSEIITLQNVTNEVVAPQFYSGCAQLYIQSDKTSPLSIPPASKASIPGHLSPQDPGLIFNIYDRHRPAYVIPGPAVFFPGPVAPSKVKAATPLSEAQGGIPEACLLKNANWCGFEVPDYTTEDGCWASAEDCWRQADACHDAAPPTGHRNCEVWQAKKCEVLQEACHAKRFTGPPNKGEKIKEEVARVVTAGQIPAVEGG
ncbi:glycosyl hydrolase family 61-domain-containing protein, partial [Cercophora newfieldiana]